ncbi:hypothetical protein VTL71DRAFT_15880 [Oculimacula yallundae]|uniref:Uncharacterized protein n=1 Tax=Oculimacula yallundae TaxID=86028 RepID=A0ABR4CCY1_9HELO
MAMLMPTTTSVANKPTKDKNTPNPNHSYKRIGYYEASSQPVESMLFLGNFRGQGSGVFEGCRFYLEDAIDDSIDLGGPTLPAEVRGADDDMTVATLHGEADVLLSATYFQFLVSRHQANWQLRSDVSWLSLLLMTRPN